MKNKKNNNNNTEEEEQKKEWTKTIKSETIIRRSIKGKAKEEQKHNNKKQ